MTATKTMEERYTLQVQIETDPTEQQPESHSVNIDAGKEALWLDRLGFVEGVAATKYPAVISADKKLDVLGFVAIDDEEHSATYLKGLAPVSIDNVDYDPTQAAGSRITVTFSTYHLSCLSEGALLLVTIGLSHSINR